MTRATKGPRRRGGTGVSTGDGKGPKRPARQPRRSARQPRRSARPGGRAWLKLGLGLASLALVAWMVVRWVRTPIDRPGPEDWQSSEVVGGGDSLEPATVDSQEVATTPPAPSQRAEVNRPGGAERAPVGTREPTDSPVGHLALVIDDLGRSLDDVDRLEALGIPLSYAVLPYESRTDDVVKRLQELRREILCHLPMESVSGNNPGPGALVLGMTPRQLAKATREAIARIPGAVGVNNHMGSGLTGDRASMRAILKVLREEDLFFLDSRTSAETVAFDLARALEIPTAERQVFLDTDPSIDAIRAQFVRLREIAGRRGAAIAIGHPYPTTLEVLAEEVDRSARLGFDFVPVSFLLERTGLR